MPSFHPIFFCLCSISHVDSLSHCSLGDDGAWSTFLITTGTPPQQVQVLPSTEYSSTWVVASNACSPADPANCTIARGGIYDCTKSSSWNIKAIFRLGEINLGYNDDSISGTYGFDTLSIQGKGTNASVNHQSIASFTTPKFFVGSLGLSDQPVDFPDGSDTSPSLLTSLKNENLIPSLSFGYTAGAHYRKHPQCISLVYNDNVVIEQQSGVVGSLTLGGYDASRFTPNDISFTFAPNPLRQLVVGLQSVTYSDSNTESPLSSDGVLALVDSTVPYLWLPETACEAFVKAFGLIWHPKNIYVVNDTQHDIMLKKNPSVIFQLGESRNGGPSINITLPYASFDLDGSYPLVKEHARLFPLQRASDDNSITLGRTFFQEA